MIGSDSIQGVERFIFTEELEGGVHIIAALIGLFAIPQVIEMLEGGRKDPRRTVHEVRRANVWRSARETLSKVRALVIGGFVGTV